MSLSIEQLKHILEQNKHYINRDGSLNINELHKKAQECEPYLIELLVENDKTRNAFFFKKGSHQVFMRDKFIDYITHKDFLANSYTRYKNKIGLSNPEGFLKKQNDVVLNFPFKDCILEGGQSKDDEKRSEIYLNEVLAGREIDRLLDRKVLTQIQRIDQQGIHSLEKWNRNQEINQKRNLSENTITDNLIIKGNNLLALHTLKQEFSGKIKLIYIDPPYNTGNDSFHYNDNFNHSTWLVFMKNRLEIAKELLKEDGVIFVQCDDNEQAYLKVLMDEIFGRENFVSNLITISAPAGTQSSGNIAQQHSYCLIFSKTKIFNSYRLRLSDKELKEKYKETDKKGNYYWERLWKRGIGGRKEDVPSLHFPVFYDKQNNKIYIDDEIDNSNNLIKIIPYQTTGILGRWTWSRDTMKNNKSKLTVRVVNDEYKLYQKIYSNHEKGSLPRSVINSDIARTEMGSLEIKEVLGKKAFNYPKPEKLLQRIIEISTQENDIILDYHLGSGTTAAVAHKIGRQYIGIEQMDYIEDITVQRIKKVIDGEQGGISKSVNWKGGGDFVYMELKKYNQLFIEWIQQAKSTEELLTVKQQILEKAFLDFRLDTEAIKQNEEEFTKLKLSEQKQVLFEFLDKNQLYVNYSEKDDERSECTEQEKKLSKEFYRDE